MSRLEEFFIFITNTSTDRSRYHIYSTGILHSVRNQIASISWAYLQNMNSVVFPDDIFKVKTTKKHSQFVKYQLYLRLSIFTIFLFLNRWITQANRSIGITFHIMMLIHHPKEGNFTIRDKTIAINLEASSLNKVLYNACISLRVTCCILNILKCLIELFIT